MNKKNFSLKTKTDIKVFLLFLLLSGTCFTGRLVELLTGPLAESLTAPLEGTLPAPLADLLVGFLVGFLVGLRLALSSTKKSSLPFLENSESKSSAFSCCVGLWSCKLAGNDTGAGNCDFRKPYKGFAYS